jgi:outer membrane receptor protein involved in Fe transport
MMRDSGAVAIQDIAAYVPSLKFSSDTDPVLSTISIRGLGSNPLNNSFEPSVGFVQDEIFYAQSSYYAEMMFDIGAIEVLRGPQGTLFGKNTISGVLNVRSKEPGTEFGSDLRFSTADPQEERVEAAVDVPLSDKLLSRFSALYYNRIGEVENTFDQRNLDQFRQFAYRGKMTYDLNDSTAFKFTYVKSKLRTNYWSLQLANFEDDTQNYLRQFDAQVEDDPLNYQLSSDANGKLTKGTESFALSLDYNLGQWFDLEDLAATVILGDSKLFFNSLTDIDVSPADITTLPLVARSTQQTAELRFTGSTGNGLFGAGESLNYVAGLFYIKSSLHRIADLTTGEDFGSYLSTEDARQLAGAGAGSGTPSVPPVLQGLISQLANGAIGEDYYRLFLDVQSDSAAVFAQVTWTINEHWSITPGVRFNQEVKDVAVSGHSYCDSSAVNQNCFIGTLISASNYDEPDLQKKETDVSPKVSVQYFLEEDVNFFATWAKGFKGGGFNGSSFTGEDLEFEPENAVTIELGLKGMFFDRSLQLNATLFQTKFDDLQVLASNGVLFDVENAASATAQGLEVDFRWLTPLPFLSVMGSAGLLDATYDEYFNAPVPVGSEQSSQDLAGKRLANAESGSASLTPELSFPLFGDVGVQLAVDVLYSGSSYTEVDLDPNEKIEPYTTYNARLSIGDLERAWYITLGASNLTDEARLSRKQDTIFFPKSYSADQKPGRKVFLALSLSL